MKLSTKIKIGILTAPLLFICTMIDIRGDEKMGTCEVNDFIITPVANHDCEGVWYE